MKNSTQHLNHYYMNMYARHVLDVNLRNVLNVFVLFYSVVYFFKTNNAAVQTAC